MPLNLMMTKQFIRDITGLGILAWAGYALLVIT